MESFILSAAVGVITWNYWRQSKKFYKVSNKLGSMEMEIFFRDMELKKVKGKVKIAKDQIETLKSYNGHDIEQLIEDNENLCEGNRKLRKRVARLGKKRGRR